MKNHDDVVTMFFCRTKSNSQEGIWLITLWYGRPWCWFSKDATSTNIDENKNQNMYKQENIKNLKKKQDFSLGQTKREKMTDDDDSVVDMGAICPMNNIRIETNTSS